MTVGWVTRLAWPWPGSESRLIVVPPTGDAFLSQFLWEKNKNKTETNSSKHCWATDAKITSSTSSTFSSDNSIPCCVEVIDWSNRVVLLCHLKCNVANVETVIVWYGHVDRVRLEARPMTDWMAFKGAWKWILLRCACADWSLCEFWCCHHFSMTAAKSWINRRFCFVVVVFCCCSCCCFVCLFVC